MQAHTLYTHVPKERHTHTYTCICLDMQPMIKQLLLIVMKILYKNSKYINIYESRSKNSKPLPKRREELTILLWQHIMITRKTISDFVFISVQLKLKSKILKWMKKRPKQS